MSEEKNTELLPCPFCGGTDLEVHGKPGILNAHDDVGCNSCSAFTPAPTWNRRSLPVGVPDVLFDGFAVLSALSDKAKARTSAENVSDVLDAVVKLLRAESAAPTVKESLSVAPTVKAEQVQCKVCGDFGSDCDECGAKVPSLPAAGSAVPLGEVEIPDIVATFDGLYLVPIKPLQAGQHLMTVAQHNRIVAALSAQHKRIVATLRAQVAERDAAIEEWSGTAVQNGMEVDRLNAALSAQQSAPDAPERVIEVLGEATKHLQLHAEEASHPGQYALIAELRALLGRHAQAPHSNGVEPNELREAVKRFRDGNDGHGRGEA